MVVWHIKYQHMDPAMMEQDLTNTNLTKSSRLRHRLQIKKDDVQIVLPISKVRQYFVQNIIFLFLFSDV